MCQYKTNTCPKCILNSSAVIYEKIYFFQTQGISMHKYQDTKTKKTIQIQIDKLEITFSRQNHWWSAIRMSQCLKNKKGSSNSDWQNGDNFQRAKLFMARYSGAACLVSYPSRWSLLLAPTGALLMMVYYTSSNFLNFYSVHWCNWWASAKSRAFDICKWCADSGIRFTRT